jgi:hypothetical protein
VVRIIFKNIVYFFHGLWNLFTFLVFDLNKIRDAEVVFFFPFYHTGGAEKVHLNIVKTLANKKVCVIFTLNSVTKNFQEQFNANANCIEINPILNKRNFFVNRLLKKSIYKTINNSNNCKTVFGSNATYFYQILPFISNKIDRIDLFHAFSKSDSREMGVVNSVKYIDKRVVINQNTKKDLLEMYTLNKVESKYNKSIQVISLHPGISFEQVQSETGFELMKSQEIHKTPAPTKEQLELIQHLDPHQFRISIIKGNPPGER